MQRDGRDVDAVDHDAAAVGLVDAADEVEQRRLAAAGGAGQREEIAAGDVERHAGAVRGPGRARGVGSGDVGEPDEWLLVHEHLLRSPI